ncbi:DUF2304 domain-containing protein [Dermatophilaceae bacterium Soc4.6]
MSLRDVSGYPFAIGVCVVLLVTLAWLLRSQRLREKYSVIWVVLVLGLVFLGFVPQVTQGLTRLTGVTTPINLVFILASLALLVVCIQLSLELSRLEETTRTVAEEVALLRLDVDQRFAAGEGPHATAPGPAPGAQGPGATGTP